MMSINVFFIQNYWGRQEPTHPDPYFVVQVLLILLHVPLLIIIINFNLSFLGT